MSYRDHDATQLKNGNVLVTTPDSTQRTMQKMCNFKKCSLSTIHNFPHSLFISFSILLFLFNYTIKQLLNEKKKSIQAAIKPEQNSK